MIDTGIDQENDTGKTWILFSNRHKIELEDPDKIQEEKEKMYKTIEEECKQALLTENLIVLTGAGSSKSQNGGNGGKSMLELWDVVKNKINADENNTFDTIKNLVSYPDDETDLEDLLSRLQTEKLARENKKESTDDISEGIKKIEQIIQEECTFPLSDDLPHEDFLRKLIKARKKTSPRLKIFTLNYDTCFESAADRINAVMIDGFSFTQGGKFKSTNFDLDIVYREQTRIHNEENFYNKVFHLYKIHGSVDWVKPQDQNAEIFKSDKPEEALLIYPNSSKFENSYQMPFFEMISRFQVALRTQNTTLFIIGYGFNDNHINRIIKEALRTNINLKVIVVNNSIKEKDEKCPFRQELFNFIEKGNSGLMLVADTFSNFTKFLPAIPFPDKEDDRENQFKNPLP